MPKLLEFGPAQAIGIPRETAASQGAAEGAGVEQLARGIDSLGRARQAYEASAAEVAARRYGSGLKALRMEVDRIGDPSKRETEFETRRQRLREQTRSANPFANQTLFDQQASLYEDEHRLMLREKSYQDMLAIDDANQAEIATHVATDVADEKDIELAETKVVEWHQSLADRVADGRMTPARAAQLRASSTMGFIMERAETDPAGAQRLFERFGSQVSPQQHAALEKLLAEERVTVEGQRLFEETRAAVADVPFEEKERFIRENADSVEVADEAIARMQRYESAVESDRAERKAKASEVSFRSIREYWNAPERPDPAQAMRWWDETERSMMRQGLPEADIAAAERLFDSYLERKPTTTDWAYYGKARQNLQQIGKPGTPYSWAEISLRLADGEIAKLTEKAATIREEGPLSQSFVDDKIEAGFLRWKIDDDAQKGRTAAAVEARLEAMGEYDREDVTTVFDDVMRIETGKESPGSGLLGIGNDPIADAAALEREAILYAKAEFPELYWSSVYDLSNNGRNIPSDRQVASRIYAFQKRLEQMKPEEAREFRKRIKAIGRAQLNALVDADFAGLGELGADFEIEQRRLAIQNKQDLESMSAEAEKKRIMRKPKGELDPEQALIREKLEDDRRRMIESMTHTGPPIGGVP